MDVVMHLTANRAGVYVGRDGVRNGGFNIAAVAGQAILAVIPEVADVRDFAAGGDYLNQRTVHTLEGDGAAERVDLHMVQTPTGNSGDVGCTSGGNSSVLTLTVN